MKQWLWFCDANGFLQYCPGCSRTPLSHPTSPASLPPHPPPAGVEQRAGPGRPMWPRHAHKHHKTLRVQHNHHNHSGGFEDVTMTVFLSKPQYKINKK